MYVFLNETESLEKLGLSHSLLGPQITVFHRQVSEWLPSASLGAWVLFWLWPSGLPDRVQASKQITLDLTVRAQKVSMFFKAGKAALWMPQFLQSAVQ